MPEVDINGGTVAGYLVLPERGQLDHNDTLRSTILSSVSPPLRTQRRGPSASQSCLVEAARMFFTLSSPPALGTRLRALLRRLS